MNKNQHLACAVPTTYRHISAPVGAQTLDGTVPVKTVAANVSDVDILVWGTSAPKPNNALPTPTLKAVVSNTEALTTIDQMVNAIAATGEDPTDAQSKPPSDAAKFVGNEGIEDDTNVDVDLKLEFSPGEIGHGERFVDYWGETTRYDASRGMWMLWRNTHWEPDIADEVVFRMTRVARNILTCETRAIWNRSDEEADRIAAMAKRVYEAGIKLHRYRTITSSLQFAKVLPGMSTRTSHYDADPMVFNCQSGVVDLRTGLVAPHRAEDLLTKISPVPLGGTEEQCPRWMQFLDEIMCGDKELVAYLQRLVGYILTGSMKEQCFFLFYGGGANGKSTFINVIKHLTGAYGQQVDFTTFMDMNRGGSPRNDLAGLVGKRFVVSPEGMEGKALDEPVVKQFTGGDTLTVRFLNKEFFEFQPVGKIVLASNYRPVVKGTDHGIWRRMRLVPFLAKFEEGSADLDLTEKLLKETPAILRWAVEGSRLWFQQGLGIPSAVSAATMSYRSSMDIFQTFLDERCHVEYTATVGAQTIYDAYTDWCACAGIRIPMKQSVFGQRLEERGFLRKKTATKNVWMGVGLKLFATSRGGLVNDDSDDDQPVSLKSGGYGDLEFAA